MTEEPIFAGVNLKLIGEDGNAFAILARAQRAAKNAGIEQERITEFMNEAMSSDYNHLLATCMKYFDIDMEEESERI